MDFGAVDRLERSACQPQRIDLIETLSVVAKEYEPKLKKQGQYLSFRESKKFYIMADPDKWMQMLHNIMSNFLKYAGKNTTLSVGFFHDEQWTHVLFADNGAGVPMREVPFLKEKFYQVDKSRS